MSKQVSAVVDRISEGTQAVILAEEINEEFIVLIEDVDVELREGLWVDLSLNSDGEIRNIKPNETLTAEKKEKVSNVMDRLRKRKGSQYKL